MKEEWAWLKFVICGCKGTWREYKGIWEVCRKKNLQLRMWIKIFIITVTIINGNGYLTDLK